MSELHIANCDCVTYDRAWNELRCKLWNVKTMRDRNRPPRRHRGMPWKAHCVRYRREHYVGFGMDASLWTSHDRYEHPAYMRRKNPWDLK